MFYLQKAVKYLLIASLLAVIAFTSWAVFKGFAKGPLNYVVPVVIMIFVIIPHFIYLRLSRKRELSIAMQSGFIFLFIAQLFTVIASWAMSPDGSPLFFLLPVTCVSYFWGYILGALAARKKKERPTRFP